MNRRVEDVLREEGVFVSTTVGVSMYPMLRNRKDTVVISPCTGRLQKYDIPLYKRGDAYVLHRIVKVLPDSYVICGDNCVQREYGVTDSQILGVLTACYRGEKPLNLEGGCYRGYVRLWCALYPLRRVYKRLRAKAAALVKQRP